MTMHKCIICNWNQKDFLTWTDYWLKTTDKEYNLIKCEKCWLEQISPIPSIEEISSFYKKDYYSYNEADQRAWIYKYIDRFLIKFYNFFRINNKFLDINYYKDWNWKNFLDIWCWWWQKVELMKWYWYISEWFELWKKWKEWNIFYWDSIVNTNFWKKYDLISCSHVFEHVTNPIEFLEKIKNLLNDNWKCIILLPDVNCLSSKLFNTIFYGKRYAKTFI